MPAFQITVVELFTCPLMNAQGINWIKVVWQKVFSWSGPPHSFVVACRTADPENNQVEINVYKLKQGFQFNIKDTCLQDFHFVGLCKGLDRPQTVDNVLGFAKVNLIQCISDLVLHVLHQATCSTD